MERIIYNPFENQEADTNGNGKSGDESTGSEGEVKNDGPAASS